MKRHLLPVLMLVALAAYLKISKPVVTPDPPPVVVVPPIVVDTPPILEPGPPVVLPVWPLHVEAFEIKTAANTNFTVSFESYLLALTRSEEQWRHDLPLIKARGGNGVRIFGGALTWAGQTAESARAALPAFLAVAHEFGLAVQVAVLTDSRDGGYDVEDHLRQSLQILRQAPNGIPEIANEFYHPTQSDFVQEPDGLCELARRLIAEAGYPENAPWALGAAPYDGLTNGRYLGSCGTISVVHSARGGSYEDMWDRLTGLETILYVTGKPVISSEPIGAAEEDKPGSRLSDPAFFSGYASRLAQRGLGGVFHSEDGLFARPLGPRQTDAARAWHTAMTDSNQIVTGPTPTWDPCYARRDPEQIVECNRYRYARMTPARIAEFLRGVAYDLNAADVPEGPFGVLVKESGTNCAGISCDVICADQGDAQRQWDVLGDAEYAQTPGWHRLDTIVVRECVVPKQFMESNGGLHNYSAADVRPPLPPQPSAGARTGTLLSAFSWR